jgi:hypothetical protein
VSLFSFFLSFFLFLGPYTGDQVPNSMIAMWRKSWEISGDGWMPEKRRKSKSTQWLLQHMKPRYCIASSVPSRVYLPNLQLPIIDGKEGTRAYFDASCWGNGKARATHRPRKRVPSVSALLLLPTVYFRS